jgi:hypothetical protein
MSDKSSKEKIEGIALPEWLTATFPEHLPWSAISFSEGKYHVSHDGSEFYDVAEAFDYVSSLKEEYQVVFDSSLDGNGGELMNGFFFCDVEQGDLAQGAYSSRVLLSHTTQDKVTMLKHHYLEWLTTVSIEYSLDPDNFFNAHNWLTFHPVFWRKSQLEDNFKWDTANGINDSSVRVRWNAEENKPEIYIEACIHAAPDYTHRYFDARLTGYAPTYEEAIIMLAKKVNILFGVDGAERSEK